MAGHVGLRRIQIQPDAGQRFLHRAVGFAQIKIAKLHREPARIIRRAGVQKIERVGSLRRRESLEGGCSRGFDELRHTARIPELAQIRERREQGLKRRRLSGVHPDAIASLREHRDQLGLVLHFLDRNIGGK